MLDIDNQVKFITIFNESNGHLTVIEGMIIWQLYAELTIHPCGTTMSQQKALLTLGKLQDDKT